MGGKLYKINYNFNIDVIKPKVEIIHNLVEYFEVGRNIEFLHEMTVNEENVLDNMKKNSNFYDTSWFWIQIEKVFNILATFSGLFSMLFSSKRLCSHF